MVTKLSHPLRREIEIGKQPYVITLSAEGLKLVEKGHRKGLELVWHDLVNGDAALAVALSASVSEIKKPGAMALKTQSKGGKRRKRKQ